jgi:hypothetical protein
MSNIDIVKYLRLSRTRFNRNAEAADEIERLRSLLYIAERDSFNNHERMVQAEKCIEFMRGKKWWKR